MTLYEKWLEKTDDRIYTSTQINNYIGEYYMKEKEAYASILKAGETKLSGTVSELAGKLGFEAFEVTAFIDGANTSLACEIDPNTLAEDTAVSLEFVWEKLYYNMLKAKASWLYELPEWDGILSEDIRANVTAQYKADTQAVCHKVDRNAPCPCGSGKKYKKCCGA